MVSLSTLRRLGARLCMVLESALACGSVKSMTSDNLMFEFEERRAVQAAAVLIRIEGGTLNYTKLLKLLYLADRRSLVETGRTITGSTFVSMENGPVLSEVYNCIKQEPARPLWDEHIARDGRYDVRLIKEAFDDQLSDYDVTVLKDLSTRHRCDDCWRMIDIVHGLREWRDPKPARVAPLPASEILRANGVDEETIRALAKQREYFAEVKRILPQS